MDAKRNEDWRVAEQAASWLVRMEEDDSHACRTEFVAWAKASPRHVEELLFVQAIWSEFARIDPARQIDLQTLPTANEESVVPLNPGAEAPKTHLLAHKEWPGAVKRWAAVAACVAVGAIAWGWFAVTGSRAESQLYITNRDDQTTINMSDGSVMYLNTDSRARVEFSDSIRQVQLLSGEALFLVEEVPARPFRVITDDATIRAVGTEFNVHLQPNATRVSVIDGVVEIEASRGNAAVPLAAGSEADVSDGQVLLVSSPDVQRAATWSGTRQLEFLNTALEDIAAEFNRYNRTQIRIDGNDVRTRTYTVRVAANDPEALIDSLTEDDPSLEATRTGDEIVIRLREGE
jgi:transmembrane sensor